MEILPFYDCIFNHLEGKKHPAESPLRESENEIGYENMTVRHLATLAATTITKSYGDLLLDINAAQESDFVATTIQPTLVDVSIADESQCRSINDSLT